MSTNIYTQTKKAVIYIYINLCSPTLKSYVGCTIDFERRNNQHKSAALHNVKSHFYNAIRKNGWENFIPFILEETDDKECAKNILEPRCIKLCKSFSTENGYNMTYGGEGTYGYHRKLSEKTKAKMSKSHIGKHHSEKTKAKMSKNHKGMTGLNHSEKSKVKISKTKTGTKNSKSHNTNISKNHKGMMGKQHSEATKAKMSKSRLGKKRGKYKPRSKHLQT
jgi:group I intron endonuclease